MKIPDTMLPYYDGQSDIFNIPFSKIDGKLKDDIEAFLLVNGPINSVVRDGEVYNWAMEIIRAGDGNDYEGELMASIREVFSF